MGELTVLMDKDKVDIEFLCATDSLPSVVRHLHTCTPFVFLDGDAVVAEFLIRPDKSYAGLFDILNYAATNDDALQEALAYIFTHYRENGGRYIDVGCGNSNIAYYALFQRMGFRVVGVFPDHYIDDVKSVVVENGIVNRDMVRFRIDLFEKTLDTTGADASGRAL